MPRTEDEILAGEIHCTVGGEPRIVRVLPISARREWTKKLEKTISLTKEVELSKPAEAVANMSHELDDMLKLVIAYDRSGSLGGREHLEEHASDDEVYRAFQKMQEASFPPRAELQARALQALSAVQSAQPNNTNGSFPNGDTTPPPKLMKPSPMSS